MRTDHVKETEAYEARGILDETTYCARMTEQAARARAEKLGLTATVNAAATAETPEQPVKTRASAPGTGNRVIAWLARHI